MGLQSRLESVREQIASAAQRSNRAAEEITLVAVSKTHPAERVRAALEFGASDFGENRVQEAEGKIVEVGRGPPLGI
jgi:uncharacterized pyridoxal phosphate-containing UPF0001 family protein